MKKFISLIAISVMILLNSCGKGENLSSSDAMYIQKKFIKSMKFGQHCECICGQVRRLIWGWWWNDDFILSVVINYWHVLGCSEKIINQQISKI